MNEAETRAEHIDPALKGVGWGVVEGSRIRREYWITLGRLEGQRKAKAEITNISFFAKVSAVSTWCQKLNQKKALLRQPLTGNLQRGNQTVGFIETQMYGG